MDAPMKLKLIPLGGRRWEFNIDGPASPGWAHDRDICFGSTFVRWDKQTGQESLTAMICCRTSSPKNKRPPYEVMLISVGPRGIVHDKFEIVIPERGKQLCTKAALEHINVHLEWLYK